METGYHSLGSLDPVVLFESIDHRTIGPTSFQKCFHAAHKPPSGQLPIANVDHPTRRPSPPQQLSHYIPPLIGWELLHVLCSVCSLHCSYSNNHAPLIRVAARAAYCCSTTAGPPPSYRLHLSSSAPFLHARVVLHHFMTRCAGQRQRARPFPSSSRMAPRCLSLTPLNSRWSPPSKDIFEAGGGSRRPKYHGKEIIVDQNGAIMTSVDTTPTPLRLLVLVHSEHQPLSILSILILFPYSSGQGRPF